MNDLTHNLVGYDRNSELVVEEFEVPDAVLSKAKELARVPIDDPDAIMCYPLDAARARALADLVDAKVDPERRDYFFEGSAHEFTNNAEFHPEVLVSETDRA